MRSPLVMVWSIFFLTLTTASIAANKVIILPLASKSASTEAKISWRAEWTSSTQYKAGNTIQYQGSSYICTQSHTSSFDNDPPHGYWSLTAAKGESGVDGINCWDLNHNGACDIVPEDKNNDGTCAVEDCYSSAYQDLATNGRLDDNEDTDLITRGQANTDLQVLLSRIELLESRLHEFHDWCDQSWDNCHLDAACTDAKDGFACNCGECYSGDGVDCQWNPDAPSCTLWFDQNTGYVWQNSSVRTSSRSTAEGYCNALDLDGHDDWRLPSISELRTIVRGCPQVETGGACGITDQCLSMSACETPECNACGNADFPTGMALTADYYWSSSVIPEYTYATWVLDFSNGRVVDIGSAGTNGLPVTCVRR